MFNRIKELINFYKSMKDIKKQEGWTWRKTVEKTDEIMDKFNEAVKARMEVCGVSEEDAKAEVIAMLSREYIKSANKKGEE